MSRGLRSAVAGLALGAVLAATPAFAASEAPAPARQTWSFAGPFGTFDRAAMQRGFQVYKEVCAACHAMSLVAYRDLVDLGFTEAQIRAIAAEYEVTDSEPNDQGEFVTRPARPADRFKSPFPNQQAARAANNGAYPVDLSLITKARHNGADYVYALLTGYRPAPPGVAVPEGMYYNAYFPGQMIAMAPPLNEGGVTFADGTPATVPQLAKDVTTFLAWAAEPELEERKRLGVKVIMFLLLMTGIFYALKRRIWADVH